MVILGKIDGKQTAILGYAPGKNGEPLAIIPRLNPAGYFTLGYARLSEVEILNLPKKLERKLRRKEKTIKITEAVANLAHQ